MEDIQNRWNIQEVPNYIETCFRQKQDSEEESEIRPMTMMLIKDLIFIGIDKITKKNWKEVYTRIVIKERLFGASLISQHEGKEVPLFKQASDIEAHIGMFVETEVFNRKQYMDNIGNDIDAKIANFLKN